MRVKTEGSYKQKTLERGKKYNMQDKTKTQLADWSNKAGIPFAELETRLNTYIAEYKANPALAGKTDEYFEDCAIRKIYLEVKADMNSAAKPQDLIILSVSAKIDVTANDVAEKKALYANIETRGKAIAEKKVAGAGYIFEDNPVPEGTPLDTNAYMIQPDPNAPDDRGKKGVKNPNFGGPVKPLPTRNIISFGRSAAGGPFKIGMITERNQAAEVVPARFASVRSRLIVKEEGDFVVRFNAGKNVRYDPITIAEFPTFDEGMAYNILTQAPLALAPPLSQLLPWYEQHSSQKGLFVIFQGDVTRIGEPTANGSVMVVIEDSSGMDLEAEGTVAWVPKECLPLSFGVGSKVAGIARPNKGAGWNKETRQMDPTIERIQLNAYCIFSDPIFRVSPDEASPVQPEEAQ
jgi:hypothetical protein